MSKSPRADGGAEPTEHESSAAAEGTCDVPNGLPREAAPGEFIDGRCLTAGATAPASPLLSGGAAPVGGRGSNPHEANDAINLTATPVTKATSSTSSAISTADTAALSAPVETASNDNNDDDFDFVLTPEDFFEAGRIISVDDTTEGLLSFGTAAAGGVDVDGGDGEAGNTAPLSLSTPDAFGNFSSLPLMAGTDSPPGFSLTRHRSTISTADTAVLSAPVETVSNDNCYSDDDFDFVSIPEDFFEAGHIISVDATTEGLLSPGTAAAGGVDVEGGDGEAGNTAPLSLSTPPPDTSAASFLLHPVMDPSVVSVRTTLPRHPTSGLAGSNITIDTAVLPLPSRTPMPAEKEEADTSANGAVVGASTLSATTQPFMTSTYTPEAASAAINDWTSNIAALLAKARAGTEAAALATEEEPDFTTSNQLRQARHVAAAAMAAAAAPTRPRGANQWSEIDALVEGVLLWRLDDTPSPSRLTQHESSQAYIANTLAAAENIKRLEYVDHGLQEAMSALKLDGEASEDARHEREAVYDSTQTRLAKVLEMCATDSLPSKVVSTSAKVDTALSEWFGQLTLGEPATAHEKEARFLKRVTIQTSVREAISAMAIDKRAQIVEEEQKAAAIAREKKITALVAKHREAVWKAHAEAQAAQQAHAKREKEEERAAAVRAQLRVAQQAAQEKKLAIRATLTEVKRRRAARIRRITLAAVTDAREDRRSLSFPCSQHLRSLWRQGKLA